MIEINLLPGSVKRAPRRGLPRLGGAGGSKLSMPQIDRAAVLMVALPLLAIGIIAWLHFSTSQRLEQLRADEEAAVRDSTRYALLRQQGDSLNEQVNLISRKLEVIQEIDAGRFVWAHILDEVSRSLPSYVWLTGLSETSPVDGLPGIRLEGNAGSYNALGTYLRELEASPFLRATRLVSSARQQVQERTVYHFIIDARYQEPPPDVIQTVPLFAAAEEAAEETEGE